VKDKLVKESIRLLQSPTVKNINLALVYLTTIKELEITELRELESEARRQRAQDCINKIQP